MLRGLLCPSHDMGTGLALRKLSTLDMASQRLLVPHVPDLDSTRTLNPPLSVDLLPDADGEADSGGPCLRLYMSCTFFPTRSLPKMETQQRQSRHKREQSRASEQR